MNNVVINDFEIEVAYKNYLDQLDEPRWYLEKTFPTFYKHFRLRFDKFIVDWATAIGVKKFDEDFIKNHFIFYCRLITSEIISEPNYKDAIEYVESNGLPVKESGKINLIFAAFTEILDLLFDLPEMIVKSFGISSQELEDEIRRLSNEAMVRNKKIIELRESKRKLISDASRTKQEKLLDIINATRKKNGKINYSKAARTLGRTNHTIKSWCKEYGIK
jgi:hypothetical protein